MKELIYWNKYLIKVSQQPDKPLSGSNQIWATTSGWKVMIFEAQNLQISNSRTKTKISSTKIKIKRFECLSLLKKMKKKCLEHQRLGRWVVCPIDPARQCITLKIVGFMKMRIEEPTKVSKSVTSPILDFKRYGLIFFLKVRSHSLSRIVWSYKFWTIKLVMEMAMLFLCMENMVFLWNQKLFEVLRKCVELKNISWQIRWKKYAFRKDFNPMLNRFAQ